MPDPTLYLFDGWNLLHAGAFKEPTELIDRLASFVGMTGARGILVFDGTGPDERIGPLEIRFAEHADTLLERLAAEHRGSESVCIVSSDSVIRGVSGSGGADRLLAAVPGRRGGHVALGGASAQAGRPPGRADSRGARAPAPRRSSERVSAKSEHLFVSH